MQPKTTTINDTPVYLIFTRYNDGNVAIVAYESKTHEEYGVLTVNTDMQQLFNNVVAIRSDNKKYYDALVESNLIKPNPVNIEPIGYIEAYTFPLTEEAIQYQKETEELTPEDFDFLSDNQQL